MEHDEVELVTQVQAGNRHALAQLYDLHAPLLHALASKWLGSSGEEAEDLVHDVFIELWRRTGAFDAQRGSVRAWMTVCLRSRCLDRIRSRRARFRAEERMQRLVVQENVAKEPELDAPRALRALQECRPLYREVLRLRFIEGLSGPEIASLLYIPLGTVKSRTAQGLVDLRGAVEAGVRQAS